jgi:hypothetical protein
MTKIGLTTLLAAFAASAALAQADPHHPDAAPAAPAKPAGPQKSCPMMNGQAMMNGAAMGAHMQNGHMVDKDGKTIMGGMMGPNGMMCVPQASADAVPGKATPKAPRQQSPRSSETRSASRVGP